MLRNPAYAGTCAYGRSTVDPRRRQAGRPFTGRVRTAREDWIVFLPGLLPGYISIEQYERNRQRMDANRSRSQSMGAVREGPALLAGLVACGRCGNRMTVRYPRGAGGKLSRFSTGASSHAIMNATATAFIFELCGRNPKMITRWPPQIMATRRTRPTISACPDSRG
jgi:hypothetical protein